MFYNFIRGRGHFSNQLWIIVSGKLRGQRKLWHLTRIKYKHILLQSDGEILQKQKQSHNKCTKSNILKSRYTT